MEKAINRQKILLHHLNPSSSTHPNESSSLHASACVAGDSAAYQRTSTFGDDVVIVAAYRTAHCKAKRGGFKDTLPDDLLAPVLKAVIEKTNVNPSEVGDIVVGSVLAPGAQRASECRMAAFYAGFPETVPVRTVNRQCSSGLQAVADVAAAIRAGFYDIGIGAGLESMTTNPMGWDGSVNPKVKMFEQAQNCLLPMGITSENVAQRFGVSRKEQDQAAEQKKTIDQSILLCCKFFVSESRNNATLNAIERVARSNPETVIVNMFHDRSYNRARYDLVSYVLHDCTGNPIYSPLHQTVIAMAEATFNAINLEFHEGAHPRLGALDDIIFHPLGHASLDEAAWLAKAVAADIGNRFSVPVFLYAAAHPTGKEVDAIRRELGYYRPNSRGSQWAGWAMPETLPLSPDEGPNVVSRAKGITVIGARPWITFYNVPILCTDVSVARRIARKVSARGGGLPTVQTIAVVHEDSTEIACMLLDPKLVGADRVQNRVEMQAAEEGLDVEQGYFTDLSPEMFVEKYMKLINNANKS